LRDKAKLMEPDTIVVAVTDAPSARSLHEKLAAALGFPDYYGKNWDAFWDCITDPSHEPPRVFRRLGYVSTASSAEAARRL
jgi:RNAse (barnase) inhibitor barstar